MDNGMSMCRAVQIPIISQYHIALVSFYFYDTDTWYDTFSRIFFLNFVYDFGWVLVKVGENIYASRLLDCYFGHMTKNKY